MENKYLKKGGGIQTKLTPFVFNKVFKDHAIDGETLPLLTEEHLRSTLGLKLGPALKIQSQVWIDSMKLKRNLLLLSCCNIHNTFNLFVNLSPLWVVGTGQK